MGLDLSTLDGAVLIPKPILGARCSKQDGRPRIAPELEAKILAALKAPGRTDGPNDAEPSGHRASKGVEGGR